MTHRDWKTIFECEALLLPFVILLVWVVIRRGKADNPKIEKQVKKS